MGDVKKERFTPGPWFYEDGCVFAECDKCGDAVAGIGNAMFRKKDEEVANMRLIAQAPEMYALIKKLHKMMNEMKWSFDSCGVNRKKVETVLKKARGER